MTTQTNPTPEIDATQSAGDIMADSTQRALKKIVILLGIAVYLAGVVYAEVHGLNVLSKGVNPDFLMWSYVGMVALGISAVALPLALHVWTFEAMHRIAALVFYVVDIALLGVNSFVDFGVNTGETLPQWAQLYADFVMPATPVIAAVGWSILFLLDPSTKALIMGQTLRASIREALSQRIITAAKGANVSEAVNNAARLEVDKSLTDLFGRSAVVVNEPRRYEVGLHSLEEVKPKRPTPPPFPVEDARKVRAEFWKTNGTPRFCPECYINDGVLNEIGQCPHTQEVTPAQAAPFQGDGTNA